MYKINDQTKQDLTRYITAIISETNGISLADTLELLLYSDIKEKNALAFQLVEEFQNLLFLFQQDESSIHHLLDHPFADALFEFFRKFPLRYKEEHIHLTGSLTAEFLLPYVRKLMEGDYRELYEEKIKRAYGLNQLSLETAENIDDLIRLKEGEGFETYLRLLYLPKLILTSREVHSETAYHMANELYYKYNTGHIRLKFTLARQTSDVTDQIPGTDDITPEDVVLGLYEGFREFQKSHPDFKFVLSPSFRKERSFFDSNRFASRQEHFAAQVDALIELLDKYPFLEEVVTDVDTVGSENDMYRKEHFYELQRGLRKLQYRGFKIRSHHGETWYTLKKGIQAVDNSMNIWHIDTLEHGISLGINPNFYFHRLYQNVLEQNAKGQAPAKGSFQWHEIQELDWGRNLSVMTKVLNAEPLNEEDRIAFVKAKFHTAREVEHYQHDVLNRMIQKGVSLVSLPSSNNKLTGRFEDYKDHPFSWWEKKGVQLGVGTDNYVTLNTNFIQEMMILLFTDPHNLKITKLLMVTTGENRRAYISHLLWKMRKEENN